MIQFHYPAGATPLTPDETEGLIPRHISRQAQLNEWEQANILQAMRWAFRQRKLEILSEDFLRELHRKMFGETWEWAGTFRQSDKNIGVDWRYIPVRLRTLLDDVRTQVEYQSSSATEIAVRFHHRLVQIHLFPNGNGRHARLSADFLSRKLTGSPLSWVASELTAADENRRRYIAALRAADAHDYRELLEFCNGKPRPLG